VQNYTLENGSCKIIFKKKLCLGATLVASPYLTEANKKTRLKWCIDMIKRGLNGDLMFKNFFDIVFIDEKWLYLPKIGKILFPTQK
jgi:hypothetical protein